MPYTSTSFRPGCSGGPGRPRRRTEARYLRATIGRVSLDDWREVVDMALAQAKRGDRHARRWLSDIILGRDVLGVVELLNEMEKRLNALDGHDGVPPAPRPKLRAFA